MNTKRCKALAVGLLGTTMLVGGSRANAQTVAQPNADQSAPAADNSAQGDIIVTAQKRSESIQRVPISMQALTPEVLAQHQVQSFDDYTKLLPSASYQTLGPGLSTLSFRGIFSGKDGNVAAAQPTSGVYLDEVPVTTIGALLDVHVYDVARVEALAGPQGTLFGASSLAGTLRIITNKPDPSRVSASYDLQLNKFGKGAVGGTAEGYVNVPLNDRTALRIVGFYEHDGGYIDNVLGTRTFNRPHTVNGAVVNSPLTVTNANVVENNFNDATTYGGRAALGIELSDDWTITPSIAAQEQHTNGSFLYDPKVGDLAVRNYITGESEDKWYQAALTVNGKVGNWNVLYAGGYIKRHNSATADYSYYTVAYDTTTNFNYLNTAAGVPINPNQFVRRDYRFTKQSHELRLSSPTGERLQVTAGLFFQRQQTNYLQGYFVPGAQAAVTAPTVLVTGDDQFVTRGHRVDRDYAIFGQADFKITPTLTLTGGIRGFKYRNTLVGFSGSAGTVRNLCAGVFTASCVSIDKEAKGTGETHKVSLSWQVTPDKMIYATYSTGFRPGGINRPAGFAQYDPDTLTNYELGFKTSFFDRKLRFNAALYQEDWHGVQYSLPGANGVSSIVNAGNARVRGAEIDLSARLGGLTLSASGAYNDGKLTTPFCNLPNGVLRCDLGINAPAGTRLPVQPRLKGNVTARYEFDVGSTQLFTQASMLHQSSSTSVLRTRDNNALGNVPAFTTFDFSFGGEIWGNSTFEFFIQNAFDERGQLSRNSQCVLLLCLQNGRTFPVKPQLFGVKFGQKF